MTILSAAVLLISGFPAAAFAEGAERPTAPALEHPLPASSRTEMRYYCVGQDASADSTPSARVEFAAISDGPGQVQSAVGLVEIAGRSVGPEVLAYIASEVQTDVVAGATAACSSSRIRISFQIFRRELARTTSLEDATQFVTIYADLDGTNVRTDRTQAAGESPPGSLRMPLQPAAG